MRYYAKFTPENGTGAYNVTFPDVPGAVTFGQDLDAAKSMAREALELALSWYISDLKELPVAKAGKGRGMYPVELSASASVKARLYETWLRSGVSKSELARRMGIHKSNVSRIFDITRETRLEQLESAFLALNHRLRLEITAA